MPASQLATLSGTESAAASTPAQCAPQPLTLFLHSAERMEWGGHREEPSLYRLPNGTEETTPRHCCRCPWQKVPRSARPPQHNGLKTPDPRLQSPACPPQPPHLAPLPWPPSSNIPGASSAEPATMPTTAPLPGRFSEGVGFL